MALTCTRGHLNFKSFLGEVPQTPLQREGITPSRALPQRTAFRLQWQLAFGQMTLNLLITFLKCWQHCRPRVQLVPPQTRSVQKWSTTAWDSLMGCFECTDWLVFEDTAYNISELADSVCSYNKFLCWDSSAKENPLKFFQIISPGWQNRVKESP